MVKRTYTVLEENGNNWMKQGREVVKERSVQWRDHRRQPRGDPKWRPRQMRREVWVTLAGIEALDRRLNTQGDCTPPDRIRKANSKLAAEIK